MTFIIAVFVILLSCQALGSDVDFRVTPSILDPLTSINVTLTCSVKDNDDYLDHSNQNISWIRIVKNKQDQWHVIAQISAMFPNQVDIVDNSFTWSSGTINNVKTSRSSERSSHLKIVWAKAGMEMYGEYRCDVIGILDNTKGTTFSISRKLKIGDELDSLDIFKLKTRENEVIIKRLNELFHSQLMAENRTSLLESRFLEIENRTLASLSKLESTLQEQVSKLLKIESDMKMYIAEIRSELINRTANFQLPINSGSSIAWPRGTYALLQPSSGCPVQGESIWQDGWLRIHTESSDRNKDELSTNSHLDKSTLTRVMKHNFVNLHFCVKSDEKVISPIWPSGSFCINKKENCPSGFSSGFLRWDEEDENIDVMRTFGSTLPDNENDANNRKLYFCCREDNDPDVPIVLPIGDPFYLYRYGGKCQQVHGMKVTEEFISFDTENNNNNDFRNGVYPDGTINDMRMELCYYEK